MDIRPEDDLRGPGLDTLIMHIQNRLSGSFDGINPLGGVAAAEAHAATGLILAAGGWPMGKSYRDEEVSCEWALNNPFSFSFREVITLINLLNPKSFFRGSYHTDQRVPTPPKARCTAGKEIFEF